MMRRSRLGIRIHRGCCVVRTRLCCILPRVLRPCRTIIRMPRARRCGIRRSAMHCLTLFWCVRLRLFLSVRLSLFLPLSLSLPLVLRMFLRRRLAVSTAASLTLPVALPLPAPLALQDRFGFRLRIGFEARDDFLRNVLLDQALDVAQKNVLVHTNQ